MNDVRHRPRAGQATDQPASVPPLDIADPRARGAWVTETRALLHAVRSLAFDAVAPHDERQYSRQYLRRVLKSRLRALDARITAVDPSSAPPVESGAPAC